MRHFILTALIAVTLASNAFATEGNKVNILIKQNFNSVFLDAKNVAWTTSKEFATVTFTTSHDVDMKAFYNYNGELLGTSETMSLDRIPARAKRAVAKKYGNYTIAEAIKYDRGDETAYFLSAKNDAQSLILKVVDGQVSIYK